VKNLWLKFIFIVFLFFIALSFASPNQNGQVFGVSVPDWFPDKEIMLGLDLQGGSQLTYDIDLSEVPPNRQANVVNGTKQIIEKRVNGLGVTEALVQTQDVAGKTHIIVELPGIQDLEKAKEVVGKVVQLKFKEQGEEPSQEEMSRIGQENKARDIISKELFNQAKTVSLKEAIKNTNMAGFETEAEKKIASFKEASNFTETDKLPEDMKAILSGLNNNEVAKEIIENEYYFQIVKLIEKKTEPQKEISASHILVAYKGSERASELITRTKEEALTKAKELLTKIQNGEDFATLAKEESDEQTENGELEAPVKVGGSYVKEFTDATLLLEHANDVTTEPIESPFGYHIIKAREINEADQDLIKYEQIILQKEMPDPNNWKETELTGEHFKFAGVGVDQNTGEVLVNISFNDEGADLFAVITKRNIDKPLAIFLDNKPIIGDTVYAPNIRQEITGGQAQISGGLTHKEALELAQNLNAGAIPAPISLIGEKTIGSILGEQALANGVKAGLIGIVILFVYMILYYKMAGLMADIALSIYTIFIIAIFKIFGVTLSLAGIAAIIFSIGIAVDANILIFERMKEELKAGKDTFSSLKEGFIRAWNSIRDSNVSSLLICAVLFIFGASMIRGFALTLAIGIITSLFTAIFVTKTLLLIITEKFEIGSLWLIGISNKIKKTSTVNK